MAIKEMIQLDLRKVASGLVWFRGLTPQQQPGSYQGGEMMMKSVFWWRKPEHPEETTDLRQVTDETFSHIRPLPSRNVVANDMLYQDKVRRSTVKFTCEHYDKPIDIVTMASRHIYCRNIFIGGAPPWILTTPKGPEFGRHMLWWD